MKDGMFLLSWCSVVQEVITILLWSVKTTLNNRNKKRMQEARQVSKEKMAMARREDAGRGGGRNVSRQFLLWPLVCGASCVACLLVLCDVGTHEIKIVSGGLKKHYLCKRCSLWQSMDDLARPSRHSKIPLTVRYCGTSTKSIMISASFFGHLDLCTINMR